MRSTPGSRADDLAEGVVVVRHEVTYVSSLTFGFEPVSIECWVTVIRAASFTMAYEVFAEDERGERTIYLRARTVLTPYVFATERPRRLHGERVVVLRLLEAAEDHVAQAQRPALVRHMAALLPEPREDVVNVPDQLHLGLGNTAELNGTDRLF